MTWYFHTIAKHPEAQTRIREEIALVRARATGEDFTIADLNSMVYTLATLKAGSVKFVFCPIYLRRSAGIYEVGSHQLDKRQDSVSGRYTSVGFPDHNQVGQTNHINSDQEGDADRYFYSRLQSVNLNPIYVAWVAEQKNK